VKPKRPPQTLKPGQVVRLFDGKTLRGWTAPTRFAGTWQGTGEAGEVGVGKGSILLAKGNPITGICWAGDFPKVDYEILFEITKPGEVKGYLCDVAFPIGESRAGLCLGGGDRGNLVALHLVDGRGREGNVTTRAMGFEPKRWHRVQLRATQAKIETWVNKEKVIDLETKGHSFGVLREWEPLNPFGIGAWGGARMVRNIVLRRIDGRALPSAEEPGQREKAGK
jgi:hypothetical protein